MARISPDIAIFIARCRTASMVVMVFARPFSVTMICFRAIALNIVMRLFDPLGRPFGLPDWPFTNWVSFGGRP